MLGLQLVLSSHSVAAYAAWTPFLGILGTAWIVMTLPSLGGEEAKLFWWGQDCSHIVDIISLYVRGCVVLRELIACCNECCKNSLLPGDRFASELSFGNVEMPRKLVINTEDLMNRNICWKPRQTAVILLTALDIVPPWCPNYAWKLVPNAVPNTHCLYKTPYFGITNIIISY